MDASPVTTAPPLKDVVHLVFMFHETNAFAARGSGEKTALLREEERVFYGCHGLSRATVANYAAAYDRETVLSFFRNDLAYQELEKAFARASVGKFEILKRLTSFVPESRIEGKHVRTIPVAEYRGAMTELSALPLEHRNN